mmetsp:Transcript_100161/g.193400  ORF Transcript_100161/g.193400 Transcript_100161/m.193400 type:complete len:94 (-) Transcript_100161:82-363(-)
MPRDGGLSSGIVASDFNSGTFLRLLLLIGALRPQILRLRLDATLILAPYPQVVASDLESVTFHGNSRPGLGISDFPWELVRMIQNLPTQTRNL